MPADVSAPTLIDLHHLESSHTLAVYLLEGDEPALVDCGPTVCLPRLRAALAKRGLELTDIRHLLVTHVHLDHSGAAGALVAEHPNLRVHVSPLGAPHLIDPSRLERSARRVFGARFDHVCGALLPVPERNVETEAGGGLVEVFATPGHAAHHVSFLAADGTCFVGDAAGIRIAPSRYLAPGTPPPDIDLEAYERSFAAIESRRPARLAVSHFGLIDDPAEQLALMRERLAAWAALVRDGVSREEFVRAGEAELAELPEEIAEALKVVAPFGPSWEGLAHYWSRRP